MRGPATPIREISRTPSRKQGNCINCVRQKPGQSPGFLFFVSIRHTHNMVRVGVDENLAEELLAGFPKEVEIVRVPRRPSTTIDVDFWILVFARADAGQTFRHLRGVKVVQSMMAGVDWITPWLPKDVTLCDGRGLHDISTSEWVLTAILSSLKRFPSYRDAQLRCEWIGQASVSDGSHERGRPTGRSIRDPRRRPRRQNYSRLSATAQLEQPSKPA